MTLYLPIFQPSNPPLFFRPGIFGNQLGYVIGIQKTSADIAAYYMPLNPILTALFAVALGMEPLRFLTCLGVLGSGVGVLVMVWASTRRQSTVDVVFNETSATTTTSELIVGHSFLVASNACGATYVLLQKPLYAFFDPLFITAAQYAVAALAMILVSISAWGDAGAWSFASKEWVTLIYAAVGCSSLAYFMMTWANEHLDATLINLYGVLQPIITGVLAYIFLDEALYWQDALGAGLIMAGLAATSHATSNGSKPLEGDMQEGDNVMGSGSSRAELLGDGNSYTSRATDGLWEQSARTGAGVC